MGDIKAVVMCPIRTSNRLKSRLEEHILTVIFTNLALYRKCFTTALNLKLVVEVKILDCRIIKVDILL